MSEYLPMYNTWFVAAIIGNILVAVGSILKMLVWYQVGVAIIRNHVIIMIFMTAHHVGDPYSRG